MNKFDCYWCGNDINKYFIKGNSFYKLFYGERLMYFCSKECEQKELDKIKEEDKKCVDKDGGNA
jgi:hypothetical protein